MKDNKTGKTAVVGKYDDTIPGNGNKMRTIREGFLSVGLDTLKRSSESNGEWITVDEIGYLESGCPEYCNALMTLFEKKQVAAAVRKQDTSFIQKILARDDIFTVDLDDPVGRIGCVIMASGMGTRFGGNKLMAEFYGEPLISCILENTANIFFKRVVVTRSRDVADLCEKKGIQTILHDFPLRSDTVRLGIEAIDDIERCVFCPSDQPLLTGETILSLALAGKVRNDSIWRVAYGDTQGAPVLFPECLFSELCNLPAGKGGGVLLQKYPKNIRAVQAKNIYELMDVDTPEDLKKLAELKLN